MRIDVPRIAVVDDDAGVLDSMRFLLEVAGYEVETFASPREFLARDRAGDFDRLIFDHHMPSLTGLELAGRLRAKGVAVPIMLMTGSLSPDIVTGATQIGLDKVVEKPASESELMDFVGAA